MWSHCRLGACYQGTGHQRYWESGMRLCLVYKENSVQNTLQEEESGKVAGHWHLPEYIFFHSKPSKLVEDAIFSNGLSSVLVVKWSFLFLNTQQNSHLITVNKHKTFQSLSRMLYYLNWNLKVWENLSSCSAYRRLVGQWFNNSKLWCRIISLSDFIIRSIIYHKVVGKTHGRSYWFSPDQIFVQDHLFKHCQW